MADPSRPAGRAAAAAGPVDRAEHWPVADSEELARGKLLRLRRDAVRVPDGSVASREVVEHPGAVAILALDEADRVLLIRQYRHPVGAELWEIPAGLRDVAGEPLRQTAERELLEETGYRASDWRVLADFFSSPGYQHRAAAHLPGPRADRGAGRRAATTCPRPRRRYLTVAWVPLEEAVRRFLAGDMHNGVAGVGILSAYAARQDGYAALRPAGAPETL